MHALAGIRVHPSSGKMDKQGDHRFECRLYKRNLQLNVAQLLNAHLLLHLQNQRSELEVLLWLLLKTLVHGCHPPL